MRKDGDEGSAPSAVGVSQVRGERLKDREVDEAAHLHGESRFTNAAPPSLSYWSVNNP
jgi:hypothetical protein